MNEPAPSRLRTRLAPAFFLLAVLPVAGLAAWFYGMSLRAVESVLERQTLAAVQTAAAGVEADYSNLLVVSNLPSRSRDVRQALASTPPEGAGLRSYARWFLDKADGRFARIIFLDAGGRPIARLDAGNRADFSEATTSGESVTETFDPSDARGLPQSGQRLRISVQATTNHGLVFRFCRVVSNRRGLGDRDSLAAPLGYVSLDVAVSQLLGLQAGGGIEFVVLNRAASTVLLAPNPASSEQSTAIVLPDLARALAATDSESSSASLRFIDGEFERVGSWIDLSEPEWTIVASVDAGPYIEGPRRTGRLTLAAAALFALVTGALILFLVHRVQRRTLLLEQANARVIQATENKSQFLRRMAHDLRSPMNAIIGYTRLVLRKARGTLDDRQVRNLENIESSSNNLLNLINEILDLSRIEAGHVEVTRRSVNVRRLADECADALAPIVRPGVALQRNLADVGTIDTDPDRLRQVIMNLLGNATKFTEAGSITLSLKNVGDAIEISVADTGIGIPAEDLPHIFDEFRQVERQGGEAAEGTGLGLAIAKRTVELLGGQITASSAVGVGTTFAVRIIPVQTS